MDWYKAYHGLPYDVRLAVIAQKAQIKRAEAVALWVALLDHASQHRPRGTVGMPESEGFAEDFAENLAIALEIDLAAAARALQAFQDKGLLTKDGGIQGWEKMQATSTRRVRKHRHLQNLLAAQKENAPASEKKETVPENEKEKDTLSENPFALAPPPPDDPAEIAKRRLRLQRRFQAKRRPPTKPTSAKSSPAPKGDRP